MCFKTLKGTQFYWTETNLRTCVLVFGFSKTSQSLPCWKEICLRCVSTVDIRVLTFSCLKIFTIQNARSDRFTNSKTFRIVGVLWFLEKTNSIITPKIRSELAKMRLLKWLLAAQIEWAWREFPQYRYGCAYLLDLTLQIQCTLRCSSL